MLIFRPLTPPPPPNSGRCFVFPCPIVRVVSTLGGMYYCLTLPLEYLNSAQEKAMQDRRKFHARERELHNGRLAMIAIVCLSVQSALAGEDSLARLFGLF